MAFQPFLAYEASAGSGKTFMLVVRYLSLLFLGKDPSKILALTFTNKAANEMLERIVTTLETLEERHEGELHEISKVIEMTPKEILLKREQVLKTFLHSDVKVMTIDKFLAVILRKFSLHAGIMPNFSTHESQHDIKVLTRFLNELFVRTKEEALINLTLINNATLSETMGLLNQLYLLQSQGHTSQYAPPSYLHVKEEILQEVAALRVLVQSHEEASSTAKKSMDIESFEALLKKSWYTKESLNYATYKKCFVPQMDELLHRIQQKLQEYYHRKEQHYFYELFSLVDIYETSKLAVAKEDSELGFDDVTALVYNMLSNESLSREFLYFRLDSDIDHLLLDEFQDTSMIQFEILAPIIDEICSGIGVNDAKSLFFVGDVKQSIYRFRGGIKELFYEVANRYHVDVALLVTNYRSSRSVVDFVNRTFEGVMEHYKPQQVKSGASEGYVAVVESETLLDTALQHVKELQALGVAGSDIAILCATNSDGLKIEEALKAEGIDVVTETTSKLIHQQNIKALIEYLKYIYFNEAIYARNFFALINRPYQAIEPVDCNHITLVPHIKGVIEQYELFDGDLNIVSFLEALYGCDDIESFIFEYERIDTASVKTKQTGVKVLTVHKSKGLEFEHVIVLDRFGVGRPNNSRLIFEYEGVRLCNIFLRQKGRDALDEPYRKALLKETKLSREDHLNALYVAFTRARESLFVVKKNKNSTFDIVGLEVTTQGHLHVNSAAQERTVSPEVPMAYAPVILGRQEELLKQEEQDKDNLHAIDFGLALHYVLEMVNLHESSSVALAVNSAKNRFGASLSPDDFDAIASRVIRLLHDARFQELVAGVCHKEQPVMYGGELRYIDLLVEHANDVTVIDYKSSRRFEAQHLQQVGFYKKAVRNIMNRPVHAYLVYLLDDTIAIQKV